MTIRRTSLAVLASGIAVFAVALPSFNKEFKSSYVLKKNGKLAKANCSVCHVGMTKKLNPYGVDQQSAMRREGAKTITGSVLKKVEGLDSDKDGVANRKEIDADTFPGDPKSK